MYKRASQFLNSMRATTLAGTGFGVKLPSVSGEAALFVVECFGTVRELA